MTDKTRHVHERFPTETELIRHLLSENSEFASLCEDYGECIEMLKILTGLSKSPITARINEFRLLRSELEEEILHVLHQRRS